MQISLIIECLQSDDICYKQHECKGKNCFISKCNDDSSFKLKYDCDRLVCSSDPTTCDVYHTWQDELSSKRNLKIDKLFTDQAIKGVSFLAKRLRKYELVLKNIQTCH